MNNESRVRVVHSHHTSVFVRITTRLQIKLLERSVSFVGYVFLFFPTNKHVTLSVPSGMKNLIPLFWNGTTARPHELYIIYNNVSITAQFLLIVSHIHRFTVHRCDSTWRKQDLYDVHDLLHTELLFSSLSQERVSISFNTSFFFHSNCLLWSRTVLAWDPLSKTEAY